jgi:ATP-binding cassette subfamily B protein
MNPFPPSSVFRIARIIRPHLGRAALGGVCIVAAGAAQLAFPQLVGGLIDGTIDASRLDWLRYGLMLLGVLVLQILATMGRSRTLYSTGSIIVADLRNRLFASLLRKEMSFFDQQQIGDLSSRLAADVELVQQALTYGAGYLAQALVTGMGSLVMIILISGRMSLLTLLVLPVVTLGGRWIGTRMRELSKLRQQEVARGGELAHEALSNIRLVHAFGQEKSEIGKYRQAVEASLKASNRVNSLFSNFEGLNSLINALALLLIVAAGRQLIASGEMTVGKLASFTLYATLLVSAATTVSSFWGQWMRARGSLDRITELLDPDPSPVSEKEQRPALLGSVEFRSVGFSYPSRPGQRVLENFNLTIRAGEKVALIGPSGAGKSTIVSLLLGFYQPCRGQLVIDGQPLTLDSRASVRRQIALVEQEPTLFSGTIRENILYGSPDGATDEESFLRAIAMANAADFIESFPDRFETRVGNRGIQLSGGQKQRIAIARALLRNPRILILDEATSALDTENEEQVQSALRCLMANRTTIMIAHRLSTIADADRVIVLRSGRIIQDGAPETLRGDPEGPFSSMLKKQNLGVGIAQRPAPLDRPGGIG